MIASTNTSITTQREGKQQSLPSLGSMTRSWDSLWQRSSCCLPTVRSECLVRYIDQFADPSAFRAVVVKKGGRLAAGLPLVCRSSSPVFRIYETPTNPWMKCGDLLVDAQESRSEIYAELAENTKRLPASFVSIHWVGENDCWTRFASSLEAAGCAVYKQKQFDVGQINIDGTWDDYEAGLSKNLRKSIRSSCRKLNARGDVKFRRLSRCSKSEVCRYLQRAFEIENRSWKGEQNTSVLANPGMFDFYCDTAKALAAEGMLEIHFLELDGRAIAFEIGYLAKGTFHSHKVGFDPEFAKYSPGNLLVYYQIRCWFENKQIRRVDTMGPITEATEKWCNEIQPQYRYLISTGGFVSNRMVRAYGKLKPLVKRIAGR